MLGGIRADGTTEVEVGERVNSWSFCFFSVSFFFLDCRFFLFHQIKLLKLLDGPDKYISQKGGG